ncbi:MAG: hypothetical protein JW955_10400 [Sedimentisphaerales bacterium]|nr:hypothetical protein [Sedimentisphaerales bacterium]
MITRRTSWVYVAAVLLLTGVSTTTAKYSGGTGEPNDPYQIATAADLIALGADPNDWDKHFRLMVDVDMAALDPNAIKPIGGSEGPFFDDCPFTGVFDGSGFSISNFRCSSRERDGVGLFAVVCPKAEHLKQESGIVRNLRLVAVELTGNSRVGGLVGQNCGTVTSCFVAGSVVGASSVGGLVGENLGVVSSCESSAFISGEGDVGGLVGTNLQLEGAVIELGPGSELRFPGREGTIVSCHCTVGVEGAGSVGGLVGFNSGMISLCDSHGHVSGVGYVGGLVGLNGPATILDEGGFEITSSYSDAAVCGDHDVGGLVGINYDGIVSACYAAGSVSGQERAGGLVGSNWIVGNSPIGVTSSYAAGPVYAERCVGGLVGQNGGAIVTSYSAAAVRGKDDVGGLVGENLLGGVLVSYWDVQASGVTVSAGGRGRTSEQMKLAETFKGWGHDGQWVIEEGASYPRLAWEQAPGDPIVDDPTRYGGGTGDLNDPYQIWTAPQFVEIGRHPADLDRCFTLMADIELGATDAKSLWPIGMAYAPFVGLFEGNGHTIAHFIYSSPRDDFVGMFGSIGRSEEDGNDIGVVQNLGLADLTVVGHSCVGGLAGTNDGEIHCCAVDGHIVGYEMVGGLVGLTGWGLFDGAVFDCHFDGHIAGQSGVGGLIGGGIGLTVHSYAAATVVGGEAVGGFIGDLWTSRDIDACFWDITISQIIDGVGSVDPDPSGVIGCSTTQMQQKATFMEACWDFVGETVNGAEDIWWIDDGKDYPHLWWERK